MAKPKNTVTLAPKETSEAQAPAQQQPAFNWRVLGLIAAALTVVWVIAGMLTPTIGYIGFFVAGTFTLVAGGFLGWVWRLTRKSADIAAILQSAKGKEGRAAALEQLRARQVPGGADAMNAIAQAQLLAQESPSDAVRLLEGVDIQKAPGMLQDDLRANLAMLYLMTGRVREARPLVDAMRLDRQNQPQAKAMYAAVMAETLSRTGAVAEAEKLVETFNASDPAYAPVRSMLLRAHVYTFSVAKKQNRARTAMEQLLQIDANMVAAFLQKGTRPDVAQLAKQVLGSAGAMPKPKMRLKV